MSDQPPLFKNFSVHTVKVGSININCRVGGEGPPLLLLHGCPQTHVMWHKLAPELAKTYTVVASDLRGYGDSSKPQGLPDHANYAFREMASDQLAVMKSFGFDRFYAIGHDRGARVLHRMALDHPQALEKVCLLDILPTGFLYAQTDKNFASRYWEWFFFIQESDFPETLLAANPLAFLRYEIGDLVDAGSITQPAWQEYLRVLSHKDAMHGMCEDYRAGVSIDLQQDEADSGKRIECPLLVLWATQNPIWLQFDMLDVWRGFARNVQGAAMPSGHYMAEEIPEKVLNKVLPFLGERRP
ncbi:alpha/beta hydrolase [Mesorhizobium sp. LNHC252B00]|uniref:alpha/beta fold hydrolase n=1 Tax=Mesorhizobium sp. LNHC252B00 TaxID=1287252 RepID=UPI0004CE175E|nr:alpha/beta hydrolase [Mesorhizobium sp. LNHC252B00]